ncbi:MAG: hypothetical protein L6E13_12375 [Firmicutes bacterium]|nr:hypothetical protein [Bacillota bacterium]
MRALPTEIARIPLYWVAEAGFTENPARGVLEVTAGIALAEWLMDHRAGVAAVLSEGL